MRVGVIGLGNIGGPVATNLVADGHEVAVFDIDAGSIGGHRRCRRRRPPSPRLAVATDITLLSLPTPEVVEAVAAEWAAAAAPGSVLVDLSTNSPAVVRSSASAWRPPDTISSRRRSPAGHRGPQNRMLVFMVGGDDEPVARVLPVLEPLGRATFHLGALGLGNTMKLVNSLVAFTATWVSLEGLSMAAKAGIPVQQAVDVLRTGGAGNFYLDRMVEGIDHRDRPTQFALELAAKDAGLIVETGAALGVPTPAGVGDPGGPAGRRRGRARSDATGARWSPSPSCRRRRAALVRVTAAAARSAFIGAQHVGGHP